jgi:hypothetical protein
MVTQDDMQHVALRMLEMEINIGRAIRENDRLNEELAKATKGGNEAPIVPPGAEPEPKKEGE